MLSLPLRTTSFSLSFGLPLIQLGSPVSSISSLSWQGPISLATFTVSARNHGRKMPRNVQRAAHPTARLAKCPFFAHCCLTRSSVQLLRGICAAAARRFAYTATNATCEGLPHLLPAEAQNNTGPGLPLWGCLLAHS